MEVTIEHLAETFSIVCRFCLSSDDCLPIFLPDKSFNEELQEGFEIIASKVDEHDELPNNVCRSCMRCITDFISFEARCSRSYEMLEQVIHFSERSIENGEQTERSKNSHCSLILEYENSDVDFAELTTENAGTDAHTEQGNHHRPKHCTLNNGYQSSEELVVFDEPLTDESDEFRKHNETEIEENDITEHHEQLYVDEGQKVINQECLQLEVEITTKPSIYADSGSENGEFAESIEHLSDEQRQMFFEATNAKVLEWVFRGRRKIPVVECTFCNKTYRGRNTLRKHLKLHFKIKNYACQYCARSFSDRSSLRLHELRHAAIKSFNCENCDRSYYSQAELKQHCVLQHEERKFVCTVCCAKFPSKTLLNDHSRVHMADRPYVCNICGYSFKRNRNLTRHLICHKDANPKGKVNGCMLRKSISCPHCSLLFEVPTELLEHLIEQHPQEYEMTRKGIHYCPYCNKSFDDMGLCLKHRNKHYVIPVNTAGGRIYECGECGRQLRYKSLAQKHLLSHNTKRILECPYDGCSKKYKHKVHYSRHIQEAHQ